MLNRIFVDTYCNETQPKHSKWNVNRLNSSGQKTPLFATLVHYVLPKALIKHKNPTSNTTIVLV